MKVGNNYFAKIVGAQQMLTSDSMVTPPLKQAADVSKRALNSMLSKDNTKALLAQAKSHKPLFGTSQRYLNVLSALENYQNAPVPEDPLHSEGHAKWERLSDLKRAVDAYKQEKIQLGHFDAKGNMAQEFSGKALSRIEDVDKIGKFADKLLEQKKQAIDADNALSDAQAKQVELDEFKAKSPEEQQAILDQKRAQEEIQNQDLSVRIANSLAEDDDMAISENDFDDALSMDDVSVDMN